jgi:hypothetical protein
MMKKIYTILLFLVSTLVFANNYEVGIVVGDPLGLSTKFSVGENRSVDVVLAHAFNQDYSLRVHADYLFENMKSFTIQNSDPLNLYYGIGGRAVSLDEGRHKNELAIGPRVPVGVQYVLGDHHIDLFAELAVAFNIIPQTNIDLEGGVGMRFMFK